MLPLALAAAIAGLSAVATTGNLHRLLIVVTAYVTYKTGPSLLPLLAFITLLYRIQTHQAVKFSALLALLAAIGNESLHYREFIAPPYSSAVSLLFPAALLLLVTRHQSYIFCLRNILYVAVYCGTLGLSLSDNWITAAFYTHPIAQLFLFGCAVIPIVNFYDYH